MILLVCLFNRKSESELFSKVSICHNYTLTIIDCHAVQAVPPTPFDPPLTHSQNTHAAPHVTVTVYGVQVL